MSVNVPYGPEKKSWEESLSPFARSPNGRLLFSPPSWDPLKCYDYKRETVTNFWHQVPSTGLSKEQRTKALAETARAAQISTKDTLGNFREFADVECAQGFLNTHLNNCSDPFGPRDWSTILSITMHHSCTPNGHMLQSIPKATGATPSLLGQFVSCVECT